MKRPPSEATLHSRANPAFNHSSKTAEIRTAPRSVLSKLGHSQERIRPLAHHHWNNNTPCNSDGVSSGPKPCTPVTAPVYRPDRGCFFSAEQRLVARPSRHVHAMGVEFSPSRARGGICRKREHGRGLAGCGSNWPTAQSCVAGFELVAAPRSLVEAQSFSRSIVQIFIGY